MKVIEIGGQRYELPDSLVIIGTKPPADCWWNNILGLVCQVETNGAYFKIMLNDEYIEEVYCDQVETLDWMTPEKFAKLKAFV